MPSSSRITSSATAVGRAAHGRRRVQRAGQRPARRRRRGPLPADVGRQVLHVGAAAARSAARGTSSAVQCGASAAATECDRELVLLEVLLEPSSASASSPSAASSPARRPCRRAPGGTRSAGPAHQQLRRGPDQPVDGERPAGGYRSASRRSSRRGVDGAPAVRARGRGPAPPCPGRRDRSASTACRRRPAIAPRDSAPSDQLTATGRAPARAPVTGERVGVRLADDGEPGPAVATAEQDPRHDHHRRGPLGVERERRERDRSGAGRHRVVDDAARSRAMPPTTPARLAKWSGPLSSTCAASPQPTSPCRRGPRRAGRSAGAGPAARRPLWPRSSSRTTVRTAVPMTVTASGGTVAETTSALATIRDSTALERDRPGGHGSATGAPRRLRPWTGCRAAEHRPVRCGRPGDRGRSGIGAGLAETVRRRGRRRRGRRSTIDGPAAREVAARIGAGHPQVTAVGRGARRRRTRRRWPAWSPARRSAVRRRRRARRQRRASAPGVAWTRRTTPGSGRGTSTSWRTCTPRAPWCRGCSRAVAAGSSPRPALRDC